MIKHKPILPIYSTSVKPPTPDMKQVAWIFPTPPCKLWPTITTPVWTIFWAAPTFKNPIQRNDPPPVFTGVGHFSRYRMVLPSGDGPMRALGPTGCTWLKILRRGRRPRRPAERSRAATWGRPYIVCTDFISFASPCGQSSIIPSCLLSPTRPLRSRWRLCRLTDTACPLRVLRWVSPGAPFFAPQLLTPNS